MIEKYPRLVETAIEFKRYSRKVLAIYNKKGNIYLYSLKFI